MADLLRTYLCCCLPSHSSHLDDPNDEHQPLLNPDILPQAPPRPANQRTTEQQREEQETLRRILNVASERLISISAPSFLSSQPSATPLPRPQSHSRTSSHSTTSASTSPTLTPAASSPTNSAPHSRTRSRQSTYRAPTDAPPAPVRARVVRLGPAGEVLNPLSPSSGAEGDDGAWEPVGRRKAKEGKRGSGRRSRPPSNHSLKTLPRGGGAYGAAGGAGGQPSPLRRGASGSSGEGERVGYGVEGEDDEGAEDEGEEEDEEADDSRFDTLASYRTASSGGGGGAASRERERSTIAGGSRLPGGYPRGGLRDLWAGQGSEGEGQSAELTAALARLEADVAKKWTLPDVGAVVGELGGGEDGA
ncbi:hypothetical protein JCM6882_002980 [Rhodosporidiobolus microsporus]